MKKLIILTLILLCCAFKAYSQSSILSIPKEAREGLSKEEESKINKLRSGTLFNLPSNEQERKWFDGAFLKVLGYFDQFFLFFQREVRLIAMICMTLSIGIGCVKLVFGGVEVNKFLVQILMSVMTCMIVIAIYPAIMRNILKVTHDLAYGAVYYEPFKNKFKEADEDSMFRNYVVNIAAPDYIKTKMYYISGNWVAYPDSQQKKDFLAQTAEKAMDKYLKEMGQPGNSPIEDEMESSIRTGAGAIEDNLRREYTKDGKAPNPNQLNSLLRAGAQDVENILTLNIIDKKTGMISINQLGKISFITLKGIWGTLSFIDIPTGYKVMMFIPHLSTVTVIYLFRYLPYIFFCLFITLFYLFTIAMAVVNYMMCIVQFGFLYGLGILFVPMMLWDGTKTMFEKLVGSMMNITVHLLVKALVVFLVVLVNIEILKNLYLFSDLRNLLNTTKNSRPGMMEMLEFYFSAAFLTVFVKLFSDQSTSIAEFLCGGSPRLSFGEFAQAAAAGGAAAIGAGMATKAVAGGALKTAAVMGGGAGSTFSGASGAAALAKGEGKGFGGQAAAFLGSAGRGAVKSLSNGAASIAEKGLGAIANAPRTASSLAKFGRYGIMPAGALSAEGVGLAPMLGGGRGGSGGGKGPMSSGEYKSASEAAQSKMKSNNAYDRMSGAIDMAKLRRTSGREADGSNIGSAISGEYTGLGGLGKALKSGINDYQDAEIDKNPGTY